MVVLGLEHTLLKLHDNNQMHEVISNQLHYSTSLY